MTEAPKPQLHLTGLWFSGEHVADHWYLAFEAYGHAMACATALELQIGLTILKAERLGLSKRKASQRTQDEWLIYAKSIRRKPMAKLISELRKCFNLSDQLLEAMEIAKVGRDFLAHNFWQANLGNLFDPDRVELIAEQCGVNAWHCIELSRQMTTELGIDVSDFVTQAADSALSKRDDLRSFLD